MGSPRAPWVTRPWGAPRFPPPPPPCGPASTAHSWTSLEQSTVKCAAYPAVKAPPPSPPTQPTACFHQDQPPGFRTIFGLVWFSLVWLPVPTGCRRGCACLHQIQSWNKKQPNCLNCSVSLQWQQRFIKVKALLAEAPFPWITPPPPPTTMNPVVTRDISKDSVTAASSSFLQVLWKMRTFKNDADI